MIFDLLTVAAAFLVSVALYPLLIKALRRMGIGQVIQVEMAEEHQRKRGTPTGGGVLFIALGITGGLLSLIVHRGALVATVALLLFGALGLLDDAAKLHIGQVGIPARLKLPLQLVLAIPVVILAHGPQHLLPESVSWLYWPLALVAVVGTVNAVNFNDGLDGLAGGQTVIAMLALVLLLPGAGAGEKAVAMTLVGGLLGFLVYNRYPARIFMGDAGALGLGGALAAMALQQGWVVLLPLVALVPAIEVVSVILQVTHFKLTRGRRIFRDSPIHLAFQKDGWSEPRIVVTFWATGLVAALLAGWLARAVLP